MKLGRIWRHGPDGDVARPRGHERQFQRTPDERLVGGVHVPVRHRRPFTRGQSEDHGTSTTSASASPNPQRRPIAANCSSG